MDADIVVMSDANTMYSRDAVQKLVAPFADPQVGCVSGELGLEKRARPVLGTGPGQAQAQVETGLLGHGRPRRHFGECTLEDAVVHAPDDDHQQ